MLLMFVLWRTRISVFLVALVKWWSWWLLQSSLVTKGETSNFHCRLEPLAVNGCSAICPWHSFAERTVLPIAVAVIHFWSIWTKFVTTSKFQHSFLRRGQWQCKLLLISNSLAEMLIDLSTFRLSRITFLKTGLQGNETGCIFYRTHYCTLLLVTPSSRTFAFESRITLGYFRGGWRSRVLSHRWYFGTTM